MRRRLDTCYWDSTGVQPKHDKPGPEASRPNGLHCDCQDQQQPVEKHAKRRLGSRVMQWRLDSEDQRQPDLGDDALGGVWRARVGPDVEHDCLGMAEGTALRPCLGF